MTHISAVKVVEDYKKEKYEVSLETKISKCLKKIATIRPSSFKWFLNNIRFHVKYDDLKCIFYQRINPINP